MWRLLGNLLLGLILLAGPMNAWAAGEFEHLATFRGVGKVLASVVGPGPAPGTERLYQSYIYAGSTLEIVAVDPETGGHAVYQSPVPSEYGAWALAAGPDGNIYVGTLPQAHLLKLEPATGRFTDLGRPSQTEQYIWQLALGPDRKLYGCTYPSAKLVRFDPATGRSEDLGRMDPQEKYARFVAASDDGFVYVGIGSSQAQIAAYEIASGKHKDVLPEKYQAAGFAELHRGDDGRVYARVEGHNFRLEKWEAVSIQPSEVRTEQEKKLATGRVITQVGESRLRLLDPKTKREIERPFDYKGKELNIFRLGIGPDGMLYGSSLMPAHFFRVDPKEGKIEELGSLGEGEIYSFLSHGKYLLGAAYGGKAPLMKYDPQKPFSPGAGPTANPILVNFEGQNTSWRPMAMIAGPDGKIYIGAVAGYGLLGGPLSVWNPATNEVKSYPHVVKDQSVVSLTVAEGLIVGGTTIHGGGGSNPTQREAKLFLWDPQQSAKVFEMVPVASAPEITDLITAPNGLVYGIAGGERLFVFDLRTRKVKASALLPFRGVPYNSIGLAPDARMWGLSGEGIFVIDAQTEGARLIAKSTFPVTAGFGLQGSTIYYRSLCPDAFSETELNE